LYEAYFEHSEQLSQLAQLQILNGSHVIISETNSNLNLPWILKGFKPSGKNLVNSLKFYLGLIFTTVNLAVHTCMQEMGVPIQVLIWLDLKQRKEFEFEIQTTQHL
jgi:hypothetical protein